MATPTDDATKQQETHAPVTKAVDTVPAKNDAAPQPQKHADDESKQDTKRSASQSAVAKTAAREPTKKSKKKGATTAVVELERVYVVPLRRGFLKVPQYKRAKKAVKTLKEYLARHMQVRDRDLSKVKIDMYLNNEIWYRGIKKPLHKVKVSAKKIDGIVYASLAEMPDIVTYTRLKHEKKTKKVDKKQLDKVVAQEASETKTREERSDHASDTDKKEAVAAQSESAAAAHKAERTTKKHTAKAKTAKDDHMSEVSKRKSLKK